MDRLGREPFAPGQQPDFSLLTDLLFPAYWDPGSGGESAAALRANDEQNNNPRDLRPVRSPRRRPDPVPRRDPQATPQATPGGGSADPGRARAAGARGARAQGEAMQVGGGRMSSGFASPAGGGPCATEELPDHAVPPTTILYLLHETTKLVPPVKRDEPEASSIDGNAALSLDRSPCRSEPLPPPAPAPPLPRFSSHPGALGRGGIRAEPGRYSGAFTFLPSSEGCGPLDVMSLISLQCKKLMQSEAGEAEHGGRMAAKETVCSEARPAAQDQALLSGEGVRGEYCTVPWKGPDGAVRPRAGVREVSQVRDRGGRSVDRCTSPAPAGTVRRGACHLPSGSKTQANSGEEIRAGIENNISTGVKGLLSGPKRELSSTKETWQGGTDHSAYLADQQSDGADKGETRRPNSVPSPVEAVGAGCCGAALWPDVKTDFSSNSLEIPAGKAAAGPGCVNRAPPGCGTAELIHTSHKLVPEQVGPGPSWACVGAEGERMQIGPAPGCRTRTPRKQRNPTRSADRHDPAFRGVTIHMQTQLCGDVADQCQLLITSQYSAEFWKISRRPRVSKTLASASKTSSSEEESDPAFPLKNKICASCSTKKTPLWRDAEDGTPLCNACGIRYKKYRIRCFRCWHIPKKEGNSNSTCVKCGDVLRVAASHRKNVSW